MKRELKPSEKVLLILCGSVILLVALAFAARTHRARLKAAKEKIEALEPQVAAADAAVSDAAFWLERGKWLDATMSTVGDEGQAHSRFLQELHDAARARGLVVDSPAMLKPEATPHFRSLAVTMQLSGPDQALYRWLAELQSPEKFQLVKFLELDSQSEQPPRMKGTVTVARLFKP